MLWVLAVLAVHGVRGTHAAQEDGVISGQVVDGVSGKPMAAAVVSISGSALMGLPFAAQPARIVTGGDGRFVFRKLADGVYSVVATKGGYADGEPGRRRPGGSAPPIVISATEKTIDVTVPLWKYGAIAGTVTDEAGEPLVTLQVRALRRASGGRQYTIAQTTFTDDRGAYRFGNLLPGDYLVAAAPPAISANENVVTDAAQGHGGATTVLTLVEDRGLTPGPLVGRALLAGGRGTATPPPPVASRVRIYPPTFYPSSLAPSQASPIAIGAGDVRSGVDLQILPTPTSRVAGLLMQDGGPVRLATLRLIPDGTDNVPPEVIAPTSVSDANGSFTFAGVVPGRYSLRASIAVNGQWYVDMPLTIGDDDIDALVVPMRTPLRITAEVRFEGNTPAPSLAGRMAYAPMPFKLEPVDGTLDNMSLGSVPGRTAFELSGYLPGRYRVNVINTPSGWMLKGAMLGGVDVSETPFHFTKDVTDLTLVFTDRLSGVTGRVDSAGADAAAVLLFPTSAQAWTDAGPSSRRFRTARPNARGEFALSSVPPGEYHVIAVPDEQSGDWRDPGVLDSLARVATSIGVGDGETKTVTIRVKDVR